MRIKVAKHIGFCFGVQRAIDLARETAQQNGCAYTLGALIHNDAVVRRLAEEGVIEAARIEDVPAGAQAIIRSHGAPPETYAACEARGLHIVDATCPFVKRIHEIVRSEAEEGRRIVIVGKASHPECVGINGWCGGGAIFVARAEELLAIETEASVSLAAQTTASVAQFDEICASAAARFSDLRVFRTVCHTTQARQFEAEELSKTCTMMLVIGESHSSNTQKLLSLCKKHCEHAYSLAKLSELSLEKIHTDDIIGVVSGASAPDWIIREVITRMSELEKTMAENPVENSEVEAEATATVEEPVVAAPVEETVAETTEESENADPSFAEEFEKTLVRIRNGQILTGSVVQIVDGEVCVNIGYKSDGFIPRSEFSTDTDVNPADVVNVGDTLEVEVIKVNDGEGNVLLSRKNVESKKMWDNLMQDEDIQNKVFDGVGKEAVKGGLIATIDGVRAFIPASQLSTKYVENIGEYVGQEIKLKVIEVDKARKRIVASHKAVMLAEAEEVKKQKWAELEVGSKVNGIVRRITDFGAFVDIGGIDGLVHVTDVAWGRVKHPSDVLSIGQEIEVLIRDVDVEKQRVSLGYKQLQPKPWTMADEKYPVGSIVEGKVVRIVPFGAFVALEPTIDGLIHISQVGAKRVVKVEDEINVGDIVRCKVLDVNPEAKRISLSRREVILEENPEIAEEIAREREERERIAAERSEQRSTSNEGFRQQQPRTERTNRPERSERRERPRREEESYELPPQQQATTSLADLFAGFQVDEEEK